MTKQPRILLIGAGSMGSLHARVISQSTSAVLAGVVDPVEASGRRLAERFDTAWSPEPDFTDVQGVVVAAPTEFHHDIATRVLDAGVPLLVEKPIADSFEHITDLIDRSGTLGVPMMCGLLERFNPAVLTASALIDNPVHLTASRHSPYAPRIRTGVAWDLLIHDVDLAVRLLGDPDSVSGRLGRYHPASVEGAEDVAEVVLGFETGAVAQLSASRIGQRKVRTLVVHEVDRMVEIDLLRRDVTVYRHVAAAAVTDDGQGYRQQTVIEIPELVTNQEPLAAQLDRFTALIEGEVDAAEERASVLPAHRVVARVRAGEPVAV